MDEFERRLSAAIKAATPQPPAGIEPARIGDKPPRRSFAVIAPVAAAFLVAGTAAGLVALTDRHGSNDDAINQHPRHSAPASMVPSPLAPRGFRSSEFGIAPPLDEAIGPGYLPNPTCRAGQIMALAATRTTTGGVFGVVRLRGAVLKHQDGRAVRCSLPFQHGPAALLGTDGRRLHVSRSMGDLTNPPENSRPDIALHYGNAIWGFAWLGSYCGPHAAAVEFDTPAKPIRVRLEGPQPRCASPDSGSLLIDGIAGGPGEPVLPPRPEYARLRLTARIQAGTTPAHLAPIDLTLSVAGSAPVVLDPCPLYQGLYQIRHGAGVTESGSGGHLPCIDRVVVVRPHRPLHYTVPPIRFVAHAEPGSKVGLDFGIAGVPELHLKTVAR